ncbi:MAG: DUF1269 domain-containing protein [Methylohalobius sp.]|nr:DUF1269 domain-containing protein [Methylohalobius sp.]
MQRLVLLVPNVPTAKNIVDDLLLARIKEEEIHIIAKEGVPLTGLPEAGLAHKTDLLPALKRGLAAGSATGLLAGLVAVLLPGGIVAAGGAVILAATLAGATVGALASSLIGISIPSEEVRKYEQAIERGELMMLIDVPKSRAQEITELILKHHPKAEIKEAKYIPPSLPEIPEQ